jgi:hypothetical protein
MSAWGKLDRLEFVSGTSFTANLGSNTVVLSAPYFTAANVDPGDSLVLGNVNYRVGYVVSSNTVYLRTGYEKANTTGNVQIAVQQSPKWLNTKGWGNTAGRYANTVSKRTVYGFDRVEANVAGNKANGFLSPGWVEYHTYTTTQGSLRRKVNTLVAMSKNFNANATGTLQTDANDDSIMSES